MKRSAASAQMRKEIVCQRVITAQHTTLACCSRAAVSVVLVLRVTLAFTEKDSITSHIFSDLTIIFTSITALGGVDGPTNCIGRRCSISRHYLKPAILNRSRGSRGYDTCRPGNRNTLENRSLVKNSIT